MRFRPYVSKAVIPRLAWDTASDPVGARTGFEEMTMDRWTEADDQSGKQPKWYRGCGSDIERESLRVREKAEISCDWQCLAHDRMHPFLQTQGRIGRSLE